MNKYFSQTLLVILLICTFVSTTMGQNEERAKVTYRAFITFQSYGFPLQNTTDGLRSPGIGLGADIALNKRKNLLQGITVGYQSHVQQETSYYISTQFFYRPLLFGNLEPSIGVGIGYMLSVANKKNPFYELENGRWQKSSQTKTHVQAPISLALGYRISTRGAIITPFIGYDIVPVIKYNAAFVVLPYSLVTIGSRIAF